MPLTGLAVILGVLAGTAQVVSSRAATVCHVASTGAGDRVPPGFAAVETDSVDSQCVLTRGALKLVPAREAQRLMGGAAGAATKVRASGDPLTEGWVYQNYHSAAGLPHNILYNITSFSYANGALGDAWASYVCDIGDGWTSQNCSVSWPSYSSSSGQSHVHGEFVPPGGGYTNYYDNDAYVYPNGTMGCHWTYNIQAASGSYIVHWCWSSSQGTYFYSTTQF
jgi:hypothetical protein